MSFSVEMLPTGFTIPVSQDTSNVLTLDSTGIDSLRDADGLCIYAPSALSGTVTIEVSPDNSNWASLTSGSVDVMIGPAKAVTLVEISWRYMRLKSGTSEGDNRFFLVSKLMKR